MVGILITVPRKNCSHLAVSASNPHDSIRNESTQLGLSSLAGVATFGAGSAHLIFFSKVSCGVPFPDEMAFIAVFRYGAVDNRGFWFAWGCLDSPRSWLLNDRW